MTSKLITEEKSFYIPVKILYTRPLDFNAQYEYYTLCPLHNQRLLEDKELDLFLRFNHVCYTCPHCPLFLSEHEHSEHTGCTKSRCTPLRMIYRPSEAIEHLTPHHQCSSHFYTNRLRIELGCILTPRHDFSPFFATKSAFRDAGDTFFHAACKAARDPELKLPHLCGPRISGSP